MAHPTITLELLKEKYEEIYDTAIRPPVLHVFSNTVNRDDLAPTVQLEWTRSAIALTIPRHLRDPTRLAAAMAQVSGSAEEHRPACDPCKRGVGPWPVSFDTCLINKSLGILTLDRHASYQRLVVSNYREQNHVVAAIQEGRKRMHLDGR